MCHFQKYFWKCVFSTKKLPPKMPKYPVSLKNRNISVFHPKTQVILFSSYVTFSHIFVIFSIFNEKQKYFCFYVLWSKTMEYRISLKKKHNRYVSDWLSELLWSNSAFFPFYLTHNNPQKKTQNQNYFEVILFLWKIQKTQQQNYFELIPHYWKNLQKTHKNITCV